MSRAWLQPVLSFAAGQRKRITITVMMAVLTSLITVLIPVSIGKYYELIFNLTSSRAGALSWLPAEFFSTLPRFMLFLGSLIVLKFIFQFSYRYLTQLLGERLVKNVREHLFLHQLRLDTSVYEQRGTGRYLLRYSGDLKGMRDVFTRGMIGLTSDVILLATVLIALASADFWLVVPIMIGLPLLAVPIWWLNRRLYNVSTSRRNRTSGLVSFVNQRQGAINTIKA